MTASSRKSIPTLPGADPVQQKMFVESVRRLSKGRDVLFHGTRYGRQILAEDRLRYPVIGHEAVSFTRSVEVAVYWSMLPRKPQEEIGAVLIFDKWKLKARYRLELFHDPIWDSDGFINDEAEEQVWQQDITGLSSLMLGVAWPDGTSNLIDPRPTSPYQFWSQQDIVRLEQLADMIFTDSPRSWREYVDPDSHARLLA